LKPAWRKLQSFKRELVYLFVARPAFRLRNGDAKSDQINRFPCVFVLHADRLGLKPVAERAGSTFVVKVLRQKTMLVSLLRCDDRMLITPYLISTTTPQSPRLLVE
jgi:hypothetical protein